MPALDSVKVEIKVNTTWTDISAYLNLGDGASIHIGRTSPFSAAPPGSLSLTLDNADGRFTPLRQVLADGTTANPYYPYLVPRMPIRWSWVKGASTYRRFTGFVKGWPLAQQDGHAKVQIEATTADDRLSRIQMGAAITQEALQDLNVSSLYWPLTDDAGSTTAAEAIQGRSLSIIHTSDAALAFGDNGPGSANGTGVKFTPSAGAGQILRATNLPISAPWNSTNFTAEIWVEGPTSPASTGTVWALTSDDQYFGFELRQTTTGHFTVVRLSTNTTILDSGVVADYGWHLLTYVYNNGLSTAYLYVDGALADSAVVNFTTEGSGPDIAYVGGMDAHLGGSATVTRDRMVGNVGHFALYPGAYATARIPAHFNAGRDWAGVASETVDERIARFLTYGGLAAGDMNLDASDVVLGGYPQDGKDIASGVQDMAVSEGGGSVVYVGVDGKVRFHNRDYRIPGAGPALTVEAQADLDGTNYATAFDDTQIVNEVAGSRGTISGTGSTYVVSDAGSQSTYGVISDSFTSYAASDDDVRDNAEDRLAAQRDPAFRLEQLSIDLATATTSTIYSDVAALDIGTRIRVTGLPATAAPASTLDVYAEGWTESYTADNVAITFDTSPADNPPQAVFDDATYGRWQTDGDAQILSASITSSATSFRTTAAPVVAFSATAGDYPVTIVIDSEHITLTSPPGIPNQTFTGVIRGVDGTAAAAHTGGAVIDIVPTATFAL